MAPLEHTQGRLTAGQRRLLRIVVGLGVAMLANAAYLLANRLADVLDPGTFAAGRARASGGRPRW